MASKNRFTRVVLVSLFFILITIPLVGFFAQERKELSAVEKRTLADRPPRPETMASFLEYPDRLEKYYNDHFGLREFFLDLYARGKIVIGDTFGVNISEGGVQTKNVIKGKEGWYFLNRVWDGDPVADYRNIALYSNHQLTLAVLGIAARKHWLEKQGIRYLLFFAPNKHTVYSEYLPDYITRQGDVSSMDQLYKALAKFTSVPFVDLRPVLRESKQKAADYWDGKREEARLYWQTDSHWNGAGADIAQYAVALEMEKLLLPGSILPRHRNKGDFQMMQGKGDLASLMNDKSLYAEKGPVSRIRKCRGATLKDFGKQNQLATCRDGKVNAVIFHDSFFTALRPFFADYFATTVFLWERLSQRAMQKYIEAYKPAIVIEQLAERFLPYVPDITGELYGSFWRELFGRSGKTLYRLDARQAARGNQGHQNKNVTAAAGQSGNILKLNALNGDPHLYLPDIMFGADRLYVLKIEITAPARTSLELFYSRGGRENIFPVPADSQQFPVNKGKNTVFVPLLSGDLGFRLRVDPGMVKGSYRISTFEVREIGLDQIQ